MEKRDVIEFFDRCAPSWDAQMVKNDEIIGKILDNAEVGPGMDVLDVACGTGVMFPYYLERNVSSVTGIDISANMANIAAGKYQNDPRVFVICGDVEETRFDRKFDRIVVYNAFPHFPNPKRLVKILSGLLKEGGRLTIAHGASREAIDGHHQGAASKVSNGLMAADKLVKLFAPYLDVEVMVSNRWMYQVSGVKPDPVAHSHGDLAPSADSTPLEELLVLMRYLVGHNSAHAQEVADLAGELRQAGKCGAYDRIMDAVSDFDMVNAKLDAVLEELTLEAFAENE